MERVLNAVERLAAADPSRPAVIDELVFHTYGELHDRAGRRACALQTFGLRSGDEVMILLPNGTEFVELLIAAVRARLVPFLLHTEFTADDISALASETRAKALITSPETAVTLESELKGQLQVISIDNVYSPNFPDVQLPPYNASPCDLVFFTSGSSGKPKGAVVPGAAFNMVMPREVENRKAKAHLLCRPLYFRAHLTAVCSILQEGNTIVLSRQAEPERWMDIIRKYQVSFVNTGPNDLQRWLDYLDASGEAFPESIEHMMSTGAPLTNVLKRRIAQKLPHVRVTDLYGSSEAGAIAMIASDEWEGKEGSCGKPLFFNKVTIADEHGKELGVGEVGEITVSSRYLMRGYYRADSMKNGGEDGVRTGDLGYFDDEGYLYIVGRINRVIQCGGFPVIPEEVEQVLREYPSVLEAAVIGMRDPERGNLPYAIVRSDERIGKGRNKEEKDMLARELLMHCRSRLEPYKVPTAVYFVQDIPLNHAGKTNYRELVRRLAHEVTSGEWG